LKNFGSTSTTAFPKALIGLRLQILVHCYTFIYAIKSKWLGRLKNNIAITL
jgi:hypothetical protein